MRFTRFIACSLTALAPLSCIQESPLGGDGYTGTTPESKQVEVYFDLNPEVEVEVLPEARVEERQALRPLGERCLADQECESTACRALPHPTQRVDLWVNLPNASAGGVAKLPVYSARGDSLRLSVQFTRNNGAWVWSANVEGASMIDPLAPVAVCDGIIPIDSQGALQLPEASSCEISLSESEQAFSLSFGDLKAGSTGNSGSFEVIHVAQDGRPAQLRCIAL